MRVQVSDERFLEAATLDQLDAWLDKLASRASPEAPAIVFIYAHGYQVALGLGDAESFLHFKKESGEPPYVVSVGDSAADGVQDFYLFGLHHTEIPRKNLIPAAKARSILLKWIQSGTPLADIDWKEA